MAWRVPSAPHDSRALPAALSWKRQRSTSSPSTFNPSQSRCTKRRRRSALTQADDLCVGPCADYNCRYSSGGSSLNSAVGPMEKRVASEMDMEFWLVVIRAEG